MVRAEMMFGLVTVLLLSSADGGEPASTPVHSGVRPNLLRGATVTKAQNVANVHVLADGIASIDTDKWDNPHAVIIPRDAVIEWDLGRQETVRVIRLQADNNDLYELQASLDGEQWNRLWVAGKVDLPGVQTRTSSPLNVNLRFLRLTASGGDAKYSATELELFDSVESHEQAKLERIRPPLPPPPKPPPPFDSGWLVVLVATALVAGYFRNTIRFNQQRRAEAQASDGKEEKKA